jgi:vacuolar-type H+-ATPase subunit D/Vma8
MMANMQDLQNQIHLNTQDLQDQLLGNDFKLNAEIQRITNEHENFKQEIRAKLISMQNQYHSTSLPPVNNTTINASCSIGDSNPSLTSGLALASAVSIPTMSAVNNLPNVSTTPVSNDVFQTHKCYKC